MDECFLLANRQYTDFAINLARKDATNHDKDAINRRLYKRLIIVETAIHRVSCLNRTAAGYANAIVISGYSFVISGYSFVISEYSFVISEYSFVISGYAFVISGYPFVISEYSFVIS
ncbi:hypothetical protein KBT16_23975, partial [Nostoc sp. CCCryo 231-06]|nr:hypothetical protein [Nostoc sp. CCCryo 231-06]